MFGLEIISNYRPVDSKCVPYIFSSADTDNYLLLLINTDEQWCNVTKYISLWCSWHAILFLLIGNRIRKVTQILQPSFYSSMQHFYNN